MSAQQNLISDIERAISNGSIERRAESLRHVTDLFVCNAAGYSDEQIALFDDVIARLAAEIETSARALLAERLAPIANAPPRIIHALAFDDEIAVAHPVLKHSERLDEESLIRNAKTKGPLHLLAISQRRSLGESITDVLVDRGDDTVVLSTVQNSGAKFSESGFTILVKRSGGNDRIASCVGSHAEIPRHHFLKLLAVASDAVRVKLETSNPQAIEEIQRVVNEVTSRIQARAVADSHDYAAAQAYVARLHARGQLDEVEITALALAKKFETAVAGIALLAEVPVDVVERAMLQERSELLLILVKAIGLSWAATKAVLQLRTRERAMSPLDIEQCLASFERLKHATAKQVLRFHQTRAKPAS